MSSHPTGAASPGLSADEVERVVTKLADAVLSSKCSTWRIAMSWRYMY